MRVDRAARDATTGRKTDDGDSDATATTSTAPAAPADKAGSTPTEKDKDGDKGAAPAKGWQWRPQMRKPVVAPDAGTTAPTGAATSTSSQAWLGAVKDATRLSGMPPGKERDAAQDQVRRNTTTWWNGLSPQERAGKNLADFHAQLDKLATPMASTVQAPGATQAPGAVGGAAPAAPVAPPTPQAQAVGRAEKLFSAYKDQSQVALDAAHVQSRYDFADIVGDMWSGKHLNPNDMGDHVLRLDASVHSVVSGVRDGSLTPDSFGKKTWDEVDGGSMYNLAMDRLKAGKVGVDDEHRMQADPLWSSNPVMVNEPGKAPAPLKREDFSFFNRSPSAVFAGSSMALKAEQLGFMQKARDGAVAVADGQGTSAEAQFNTAVALSKGDGVAKNSSQLLRSAVELTGVAPANYKVGTDTPEQLAAKKKSGEIDGFRQAGPYSLTFKSRTPQEVAADVQAKLDSGQLDHLSPQTRDALREVMGGTHPGDALAAQLSSEESKRGWREFAATTADLVMVGAATGGLGAVAGTGAAALGAGRLGVMAVNTLVSSAAFTKTMGLKDGNDTAGQYLSDLALFGTLRAASPFFAAAGRLAPGSKAAQFALRNGTQILGADAVMTGMDTLRQTAAGQTPEAKEIARRFYDNLAQVGTLHGVNGGLARAGLGVGDTLGRMDRTARGAVTADAATRERLADQQIAQMKEFNQQVEQANAAASGNEQQARRDTATAAADRRADEARRTERVERDPNVTGAAPDGYEAFKKSLDDTDRVYFDMDNTLVDTRPRHVEAMKRLLKEGKDLSADDRKKLTEGTVDHARYTGKGTAEALGLSPEGTKQYDELWNKVFWDPKEAQKQDAKMERVMDLARQAHEAGKEVRILSGRVKDHWGDSVLEHLHQSGLTFMRPEDVLMKGRGEGVYDFKTGELMRAAKEGKNVALVTDAPKEISHAQAIAKAAGDAVPGRMRFYQAEFPVVDHPSVVSPETPMLPFGPKMARPVLKPEAVGIAVGPNGKSGEVVPIRGKAGAVGPTANNIGEGITRILDNTLVLDDPRKMPNASASLAADRRARIAVGGFFKAPVDSHDGVVRDLLEHVADNLGQKNTALLTSATTAPGTTERMVTEVSEKKGLKSVYFTSGHYLGSANPDELPANLRAHYDQSTKVVMPTTDLYGWAEMSASTAYVNAGGQNAAVSDFVKAVMLGNPVSLVVNRDLGPLKFDKEKSNANIAPAYLTQMLAARDKIAADGRRRGQTQAQINAAIRDPANYPYPFMPNRDFDGRFLVEHGDALRRVMSVEVGGGLDTRDAARRVSDHLRTWLGITP
jgi:hypothetical protein